jgi:acyl-CoA synthetase (NDP forming)
MTVEPANKYVTDYERIFTPKRVAIVGVSSEGYGFGTGTLMSLQKMGFSGEIFPINPKGGTILGLKMYRTIKDIPGELD